MTIKRFYQITFLACVLACLATSAYVLNLIEQSPTKGLIAFIVALIVFRELFNYTYKRM